MKKTTIKKYSNYARGNYAKKDEEAKAKYWYWEKQNKKFESDNENLDKTVEIVIKKIKGDSIIDDDGNEYFFSKYAEYAKYNPEDIESLKIGDKLSVDLRQSKDQKWYIQNFEVIEQAVITKDADTDFEKDDDEEVKQFVNVSTSQFAKHATKEEEKERTHNVEIEIRMQAIAQGIALVNGTKEAEKMSLPLRLEKAFITAQYIEKAIKEGINSQLQIIKEKNRKTTVSADVDIEYTNIF